MRNGATPARVYLCDDVPELRRLLRDALEEDPRLRVIGEAGDAITGIREIAELEPHVVILDLSMPGIDGLEALPRIRDVAPEAAVLVFSGFSAERMEALCRAYGADVYLAKGEPLERVRAAVCELADSR